MIGFSQTVVSLLVLHMDLEAGRSFSSRVGFLSNEAPTQVQLAGWEGAVCIFNTKSDTLKVSSLPVCNIYESNPDAGWIFFYIPLSLAQAENFSGKEQCWVLCWGTILVSEQNCPSALSLLIVMGF